MNSFDTNILLCATNRDCPEFDPANRALMAALEDPGEWCIADQTLFELYRLLRNPRVVQKPLTAIEASDQLRFLRHRTGWQLCAWELSYMDELLSIVGEPDFASRRFFDAVLAVTLRRNGVGRLFSRNTRDFEDFGFLEMVNPIDERV